MNEILPLLQEADVTLSSKYGVGLRDGQFLAVLSEESSYESYKSILSEGLEGPDKAVFEKLADTTRDMLLSEAAMTTASWTPYQTLVLPLLRFVFPRLGAKEVVTVSPIDAPEVVKYFLKAVVKTFSGEEVELPSVGRALSQGPSSPVTVEVDLSTNNPGTGNIITQSGVPEPDKVILNRNIFVNYFSTVDPNTGDTVTVEINAKLDPIEGQGVFPVSYTLSTGTVTDTVAINVNFQTGDVFVSSMNGTTKAVAVTGYVSLETNNYVPQAELKLVKIPLSVMTRELGAKYTVEAMQDARRLLDLDYQSEIVSIIGQQIANDIDVEIINDLIQNVQFRNPTSIETFSKTPSASYAFGLKHWIEDQLLPLITKLSGKIYSDTNIGEANFLLVNPQDAALLQALDTFKLDGNTTGGMLINGYGCRIGTIAGRIKVVSTPNVPAGKMIIGIKPEEERLACYLYAPYIPITITPYPLSDNPTISFKSRYAKAMIRPKAFGMIEVTA